MQRACAETLRAERTSCQGEDLERACTTRSCTQIVHRDLIEVSYRDLAMRSLKERHCREISQKDFLHRPCADIFFLRVEQTLFGDLWQRLATKISTEGTYTGSRAQDLRQISLLGDLAQQLFQGSCLRDVARDLLLFTKGTCRN